MATWGRQTTGTAWKELDIQGCCWPRRLEDSPWPGRDDWVCCGPSREEGSCREGQTCEGHGWGKSCWDHRMHRPSRARGSWEGSEPGQRGQVRVTKGLAVHRGKLWVQGSGGTRRAQGPVPSTPHSQCACAHVHTP